jgi:eukaryotic-like serine/threonine-protein kinase
VWEGSLGPNHPNVALALVGLAELERAMGRASEAVVWAERALAIREVGAVSAGELARTRFVLARALVEAGRERSRAVVLAEQARTTYRQTGDGELADVEAWLTTRRAR